MSGFAEVKEEVEVLYCNRREATSYGCGGHCPDHWWCDEYLLSVYLGYRTKYGYMIPFPDGDIHISDKSQLEKRLAGLRAKLASGGL